MAHEERKQESGKVMHTEVINAKDMRKGSCEDMLGHEDNGRIYIEVVHMEEYRAERRANGLGGVIRSEDTASMETSTLEYVGQINTEGYRLETGNA